MTAVKIEVLDVFHTTAGTMVRGRFTGEFRVGDVFELPTHTGEVVHGTVFTIDICSVRKDRPDELGIGIQGPAVPHLEAGSRLTRVSSPSDRTR